MANIIDKDEFFNRQIRVWGKERQDNLQNKHIAIIGSGGLGCSLGIALGASGIGKISLIDFDDVGIHNIHRQIAFKVEDDGKKKAEVLKELILLRSPFLKVDTYTQSFDEFTKKNLKFDLIIDATDNLPTRAAINSYCIKNNQPWIYGTAEEFQGQVCFFEHSSYEAVFQINDRKPNGVACPIVMHIASLQANLALRYLVGLSVKRDLLYYLFFNDDGELETKKFSLPK